MYFIFYFRNDYDLSRKENDDVSKEISKTINNLNEEINKLKEKLVEVENLYKIELDAKVSLLVYIYHFNN